MNRSVYLFLVIFIASLSVALCDIEIRLKDSRITGGFSIYISQANYQVAILEPDIETPDRYYMRCGGALIRNDLVVTAGWCVRNDMGIGLMSSLRVYAGSTTISTTSIFSETEWVKIHETYIVGNNVNISPQNDIGLIKLRNALPVNNIHIALISLATTTPSDGTNCTITGWGTTSFDSNVTSSDLLRGFVSIYNRAYCNSAFPYNIHSSLVCATPTNVTLSNTCSGDHGAPLVCNGVLTGISSIPYCGAAPGIFTDIRQFNSWIATNGANRFSIVSLMAFILPLINYYFISY